METRLPNTNRIRAIFYKINTETKTQQFCCLYIFFKHERASLKLYRAIYPKLEWALI